MSRPEACKVLIRAALSSQNSLRLYREVGRALDALRLQAVEQVQVFQALEFYGDDGKPYAWLAKATAISMARKAAK